MVLSITRFACFRRHSPCHPLDYFGMPKERIRLSLRRVMNVKSTTCILSQAGDCARDCTVGLRDRFYGHRHDYFVVPDLGTERGSVFVIYMMNRSLRLFFSGGGFLLHNIRQLMMRVPFYGFTSKNLVAHPQVGACCEAHAHECARHLVKT